MKIAHIIPELFNTIGGLQVCVHNICQRHARNGVDTYVFCFDAHKKNIETEYKILNFCNFRGIKQLYPISKYIVTKYVKKINAKYGFDLWQINGGYPYGALLADFFKKEKIPAVLRCCGDDIQINHALDYGVRRDNKINRIITENYKKFTAFVAITDTVKTEYISIGAEDCSIKIIPNGVDVDRIHTFKGNGIKKKHGIPEDSFIILTVGRNHPKKGYQCIPGIMRDLIDKGINAYWIIIGKNTNAILDNVSSDRINRRIVLIEQINSKENSPELPPDELINYYKEADIFAMTSMLETFGIVLIEAAASGLPVVCFDAPGIRDVMNKDCSIICPENDFTAFTNGIIATTKKETREKLSKNCIEFSKQFSWDIIADRYLDLYKTLIKQ